jgi:hypothetical protein
MNIQNFRRARRITARGIGQLHPEHVELTIIFLEIHYYNYTSLAAAINVVGSLVFQRHYTFIAIKSYSNDLSNVI